MTELESLRERAKMGCEADLKNVNKAITAVKLAITAVKKYSDYHSDVMFYYLETYELESVLQNLENAKMGIEFELDDMEANSSYVPEFGMKRINL